MQKLYELREKLCKQLEEYPEKELTSATLDVIDKLTHTIKNLDKIIDKHEAKEYSNTYPDMTAYSAYDTMVPPRVSYAGRRNTRRDSMGRYSGGYSRNNDMIMELTDLMAEAPDERTRMEFQKFIQKMQTM